MLGLAAFTGSVWAIGCQPIAPPPPRSRPLVTRYDSALDSAAREKGPVWRASHYPIANLHGPYPRPALGDSAADPNDALSYYRLGDSVRRVLPGLADQAFYWALRLDPTFSDAYYARFKLLRQQFPWRAMPDGAIRRIFAVEPNVALATDSLATIALAYSPFLEGTLDIPPWIIGLRGAQADRDPVTAGMHAYGVGNYRKAVDEWAKAMRKDPSAVMLRIPRAYAWVHLNEPDSAIGDLTTLVQRLESIQRDSTVAPYVSKEFLYYSIGSLHASRHRYREARAAYEQALVENLGFYMAHVRLAAAAAALHDTATALNELQTALLIRADDPLALVFQASLLLGSGKITEAEHQLRTALSADSDYALPHVFLGLAAEQRNDTTMARLEYGLYLARAPRNAVERGWASTHLNMLYSR
ncbi:MAG TPA: tetratricopeptide repeat protein [Gemmatimonadaceae bacterium]